MRGSADKAQLVDDQWVHINRAPGRHSDHRNPCRHAVTGPGQGQSFSQNHIMYQQNEADGACIRHVSG